MKSNNYAPSDKLKKIIDTRDYVKKELACESIRLIGADKFSKILSDYNPGQLSVDDTESIKYLKIHLNEPIGLTIKNPLMKFLRVDNKLYYTIQS